MEQSPIFHELTKMTQGAVAHYWQMRSAQRKKQEKSGKADQGLRSAVTGGAQMDGFIDLFTGLITQAGIAEQYIFRKKAVELPGFFRPTKEWDLLVVKEWNLSSCSASRVGTGSRLSPNEKQARYPKMISTAGFSKSGISLEPPPSNTPRHSP